MLFLSYRCSQSSHGPQKWRVVLDPHSCSVFVEFGSIKVLTPFVSAVSFFVAFFGPSSWNIFHLLLSLRSFSLHYSILLYHYIFGCWCSKVLLPDACLDNVTSVVLDHNKISSLSWVEVFPNLTRLSMSHNRVRSYSEELSSTHRLQLTQSRTFQPSNSLNCLILDHNGIRNLHPLRLDLFPQLKLLVLNDNKISAMSGKNQNQKRYCLFYSKNLSLHRLAIHFINCNYIFCH